jgi:hypothetical protein
MASSIKPRLLFWVLTASLICAVGCDRSGSQRKHEDDNADTKHLVRAAITADGMQVEELSPAEIHTIDWMKPRQQAQLATTNQFKVFHDFQFVDRQPESGIRFRQYPVDCATRDYKSAHYDHGNGIVVADIDNDGLLDIYLVTQVGNNELWRNLGGGKFENITDPSGTAVGDRISVTASFADTDNDGDADLYVTTVREGNVLFVNDGKGNFKDITAESGLGYQGHSSSAVFFDFDRDGLLDVFLTNVGKYTLDEQAPATAIEDHDDTYYLAFNDAFSGHLKPDRTERSILFKNMGGNRFRDVSEEVGLVDTSWTGAASPIDGNGDGWPDLYVTNMQGHDEYYENDQGKVFIRKSRDVFPKTPWGSMGLKVFDFDNDGHMDVFVTDMHSDMSENIPPEKEKAKADMQYPESFLRSEGQSIYGNAFYRNTGEGTFVEVSDEIGAENYWPWGLSVGDINADGFEDAFVTSSMNYPFRYGVNSLLLNNRGQRFLDSEFILGVEPRREGRTAGLCFEIDGETREFLGPAKPYLEKICEGRAGAIEVWGALGTRSSVIFDIDNDGDLDIVTNEFNAEPMVLVSNLTEKTNVHFLKVRLLGTKSNRDGLGARVVVHTKSGTYTKIYDGQSGYLSQSSYPLYFGLGEDDSIKKIEVTWPAGATQVITGPIAINSLVTVTEG